MHCRFCRETGKGVLAYMKSRGEADSNAEPAAERLRWRTRSAPLPRDGRLLAAVTSCSTDSVEMSGACLRAVQPMEEVHGEDAVEVEEEEAKATAAQAPQDEGA